MQNVEQTCKAKKFVFVLNQEHVIKEPKNNLLQKIVAAKN